MVFFFSGVWGGGVNVIDWVGLCYTRVGDGRMGGDRKGGTEGGKYRVVWSMCSMIKMGMRGE